VYHGEENGDVSVNWTKRQFPFYFLKAALNAFRRQFYRAGTRRSNPPVTLAIKGAGAKTDGRNLGFISRHPLETA
jgi:hypothetical protein